MRDYIQPIIIQITSTRWYIVYSLSEKTGRTPWIIKYIIIFWFIYIVAAYILHKIYRFFVASVNKQKANFLLSCDTILYEFQYQNLTNIQDIDWIKEIIKKGSYEQSYNVFLEKSALLESENFSKHLKKSHNSYIAASRRKTLCWVFLMIITLGIYRIFLEN